ncbi:hypothetical protein BH11MYX2_BH11MYX2_11120 [soil metagenome]
MILDRIEVHFTPKRASWLETVEIEIGVMAKQCLDQRIADKATLVSEIASWEHRRKRRVRSHQVDVCRRAGSREDGTCLSGPPSQLGNVGARIGQIFCAEVDRSARAPAPRRVTRSTASSLRISRAITATSTTAPNSGGLWICHHAASMRHRDRPTRRLARDRISPRRMARCPLSRRLAAQQDDGDRDGQRDQDECSDRMTDQRVQDQSGNQDREARRCGHRRMRESPGHAIKILGGAQRAVVSHGRHRFRFLGRQTAGRCLLVAHEVTRCISCALDGSLSGRGTRSS